ncbi:DUF2530 domain-containing protein [Nakamurella antarctica]|uniref:DUF2530 domain-containing protein n=1 Tax=Nakamurella antarctica TaxID=1902245 RepID=A0A3G8ZZB4_9ACTN|nr:DUF2530 domain-containing protein [Nakamurella antarctica]
MPSLPAPLSGPPPLPVYKAELTRVVVPGTILWFVAFVVLLFFIDDLRNSDAMIWLWTCMTGWILGLVGLGIYGWQRSAARRGRRGAQTSALG